MHRNNNYKFAIEEKVMMENPEEDDPEEAAMIVEEFQNNDQLNEIRSDTSTLNNIFCSL